jgi:putative SOS response-associated peptidase YedK
MPVILERELEEDWLNPDISETDRLLQMLKPYVAGVARHSDGMVV